MHAWLDKSTVTCADMAANRPTVQYMVLLVDLLYASTFPTARALIPHQYCRQAKVLTASTLFCNNCSSMLKEDPQVHAQHSRA